MSDKFALDLSYFDQNTKITDKYKIIKQKVKARWVDVFDLNIT